MEQLQLHNKRQNRINKQELEDINKFRGLRNSIAPKEILKELVYEEIKKQKLALLKKQFVIIDIPINNNNRAIMMYIYNILNKAGFITKTVYQGGKTKIAVRI